MKSSPAPNKTPSLKRPLAFFFFPPSSCLPLFPLFFLLSFFPALCCFYLTLGKHARLICAGGPPREDDSGVGVCVSLSLSACVQRVLRVGLTEHRAFFKNFLPLILIRARTCMGCALSAAFVGACVCLVNPFSWSLE